MKIICLGSLNIDRVYTVEEIVREGATVSAASYAEFAGGKGMNQSVALGRAGAEVFHLGCVGSDGLWLKDLLDQAGVCTEYLVQSPVNTGHAVIQVDRSGKNCIIVVPGANGAVTQAQIRACLDRFTAGDLLLMQTIKIDALPEQDYVDNSESSTGGFKIYMIDRVNGDGANCQTITATIVNKGGKLFAYLNADTCIDLGVELGDEFELLIRWNRDNSAAIFVDGKCVGTAKDITVVRGWNGTDQAVYHYQGVEGPVKITWTDAAIYEDPIPAAIEAFNALIAAMDLSEVYGAAQLPTEVAGAAITWTSSPPAVLANDGKVVAMPAADTAVTLTASCAGQQQKRPFCCHGSFRKLRT